MTCKAVLLDYIGTLVEPQNYTLENSKLKLHKVLCQAGLKTSIKEFMEAYAEAHEKYRKIRYKELREVTNAVWVSETLNNIQCKTYREDPRLKAALKAFFQDFINSLKLRPQAKKLIKTAAENSRIGLVSNFTYAPAIYASLRKLGINQYFNAVLVSEEIGWRKPHRIMFDKALRILQVKAEEAIFIGDSPIEDIEGAKTLGIRTIFVESQFNKLANLQKCGVKPDVVVQDPKEVCNKLPELIQKMQSCSSQLELHSV
jgi:putative hydrolase of the HAD superfamily